MVTPCMLMPWPFCCCRRYIANMISMFGDCSMRGVRLLEQSAAAGTPVEMENFFSRLTLDIIGRAVFNYKFDSLTHDDPVIQVHAVSRWRSKL